MVLHRYLWGIGFQPLSTVPYHYSPYDNINVNKQIMSHLSLTRLLVKVKPMNGRSFPENSVLRLYWSSDGGGCAFSNSSKLDVSSLLVMVGMKGGVATEYDREIWMNLLIYRQVKALFTMYVSKHGSHFFRLTKFPDFWTIFPFLKFYFVNWKLDPF